LFLADDTAAVEAKSVSRGTEFLLNKEPGTVQKHESIKHPKMDDTKEDDERRRPRPVQAKANWAVQPDRKCTAW